MDEAFWALGRGSGMVALVLFSISTLLGILTRSGRPLVRMPRFAVALVHRNASLLALIFLVIHVGALMFDPYAQLKLWDAVVPFVGSYRALWLGLGTVAADLVVALIVTALLRRRLGHRVFRVVHWLAYAMWPVAVFHAVFTGTDVATPWFIAVTALCVLAVVAASVWRVTARFSETSRRSTAGVVGAGATAAQSRVPTPSAPLPIPDQAMTR